MGRCWSRGAKSQLWKIINSGDLVYTYVDYREQHCAVHLKVAKKVSPSALTMRKKHPCEVSGMLNDLNVMIVIQCISYHQIVYLKCIKFKNCAIFIGMAVSL